MATLGQDPAGSQGLQATGRFFQVRGASDFQTGEPGRLKYIGGQEVRQGEELLPQGLDPGLLQQGGTVAGGQDGVQHQGEGELLKEPGHRLNNRGRAQHAYLDGSHREITHHRFQLGGHHLGVHRVDCLNPLAILNG